MSDFRLSPGDIDNLQFVLAVDDIVGKTIGRVVSDFFFDKFLVLMFDDHTALAVDTTDGEVLDLDTEILHDLGAITTYEYGQYLEKSKAAPPDRAEEIQRMKEIAKKYGYRLVEENSK